MKKRLLSWLLVLTMVTSLIPSTLVTTAFAAENPSAQASSQAGKTTVKLTNDWPSDLSADITDVTVTNTIGPGSTLTVGSGKTLIFHGSGFISGGTANQTLVIVEKGGHLVLDEVTIQNNKVGSDGAIYVKSGGLLDLGYNDQSSRHAPGITGNTTTSNAAKNLVVADGATVRLNAAAEKKIGVTGVNADGSEFSGEPISVIEGGRYTIRGNNDTMENEEIMIEADSATLDLTISSGSPYSDINKTGTTLTLQYVNDHLVLASSRINVLVWDPIRFWSNVEGNSTTYDGAIFKLINTLGTGNLYGNLYRNGSPSSPRHMSQDDVAAFEQFDMIILNYPTITLNQYETDALNAFLCNGGRIFMQFENPNTNAKRKETILKGQTIANALKAEFEIDDTKWVAENANVDVNGEAALSKGLTSHNSGKAGYIFSKSDSLTWIFSGKTTTGETSLIVCDQNAGDKNGEKWGALTICGDGVYFDKDSTTDQTQLKNGKQLLENLLQNSRKNRLIAATGVNPNAEFNPQATTTTTTTTTEITDYRTPYAALQKAVETNTITLLTESHKNTGLTPTRDELLFEQSTLAYEQGSQYDVSTIHADTAGVYLDITKTGEVNLYSGTVTVTPKDATYPLVLNGTMDQDGTAITGGYKITSSGAYTLDADDATSPIPAAQGGGASITLPSKGDTVTVEYGAPINKSVTYTAQEANDKIYLGYYRVDKNVGSNVTWTDADYAWHGQTFTTTAAGNAGWELNGEQLTVADKEGKVVGNYVLTKTGTETDGGNSWTVYTSKEKGRDGTPKVTVKQQHLGGDADRNGEIKVIVSDVRGDVTIAAAGDVVSASAAFVYVVGVGRKNGAETQLWEYTTVRNSKDGLTQKPINGWPWEKWKAVEAGSALGGQTDYQNKTDKFNNSFTKDPTKLDTTNATAKYTIDLTQGDQVVVFYYDWNMADVTIKATDANGNPIPDYTDQVVEYELDKQTTITAPNLIGYQPKDNQNTQDFTPTKDGNNTVTFVYEKTTGNLIYKAVYEDAAGVTHELGTFSGGTLVKGQAPNKAGSAAPSFDNYELVDADADGIATSNGDATKFDGINDITVTYKYQPKTKDIAVYAYVDDENGQILNLDKTSYKGITTGQSITITAPEIAGYKVKGDASKTFFITNDKNQNQDVKFFYEKDTSNDAYVLVKLVDSSNGDKVISEYQVPGVKDKAQLIKAPAAPYGYKADPNYNNEDKTVTPTGTAAPFTAEVVFKYVPNVHTVTVVLKDTLNNQTLTVTNFKDTYQVVDGESLKITAPSIYGYTMAASAEAVKELTNITKDETVTFEYEPIDKQMVTIHVKGVGPNGGTLFESRETVTHGTATSKEITVFTLPGLKLASAMVNNVDKIAAVANGKLNVSLTGVAKGGTVDVVLNYESNMANVTVKAMYNGQPLQSYTTSLEKGVQATINAPSVPGYTATEQNKQLTPNGDTEVEFIYTKDNGNITIIVTADGTELYRKDGGTVANGSKITLTGKAAAPTIEYYTTPSDPSSVMVGNTEVKDNLANYTYDGSGDIIVTYEYTRKTQDVTIIKKNVDTGAKIDEQVLNGLEVGKSHTFTNVTVPDNYKAVADRNPTSYFVEDKAGQTVTFWYKNTSADQYTQVTVNLICDGKVFQSYPVTAIKGVPTTILAPTWAGYTFAGTQDEKVQTVTPDGTAANDKVEFEYTITNPKTVTVVLKDNSNSTNPKLNAPANYIDSYTLKMGDSVTIWAPAIDGYSLVSATLGDKASDNKQMVQAEYGKIADGTTTVTFAYMPVSQANFVTHTVRFMLGDKELYSYDKKVDKGTGNVVSYPADAVKSMIPGYTYDHTSYLINGVTAQAGDVKDNVNATIIYHFAEDTARITIKFQDASGNELMQNGVKVPDQELTGYRKGQTVQVAAPVKEGFALVSDLIQKVTLNDANTDVAFKYAAAGDVTFTLKELNADGTEGSIIAVINGEASKTYDANTKDGNPLDLSQYGYTYEPSNLATEPFKVGGSGKVENPDMSKKTAYTVFYTKNLITVEFVPVNKTELDKANKNLDTAIADGTAYTTYKITELHPETPEKARVGETYKAVAQSFNGWALKDSYSKQYKVEAGDTSLKVYFLYEQKTTGTVTVHYHFGTGADNMGEKLNEYTITAVAGEKLKISAPEYLLDNKYHLRTTNTNPCILTVTENTETVDFYYEANFVTITTKVNLDGTDTGTHETYEVIKNIDTHSGSTTLYPPEKAGYTLIGIDATGATLTNGGADKLPTQYTNNQLALTGLTQDATVTYYYKTTKASEYQTALTVEYKYNGYDLAKAKTINANTGEANSIDIPAFDGYTASTYNFTDGSTVKVTGSGVNGTTVSVTPAEKTATLTITYTRPDGSIVLPGKNDKIGDSDDIIVKPTDPNTPPTLNPGPNPVKGSVTIPDNTTGTVTRPTNPDQPDKGKEDITVPGGSVVKPDGTIVLPNPDGGEIGPNDKIPENLPSGYVAITYDSNNGSGDVKKEIGKKGELKVADSLFTHPTNAKFEGWNDSGLGSGTAYAKDKTVDTSITLYAKWSANYKYLAKITYKPNGGTPDKDVLQNVGHDTDPKLQATLQSSPYQVSGWLFGGWNEEANGTGTLYQPNAILPLNDKDAKEFYAQWYKVNADGSITVPGEDGNPNNKDTNATAKGNGTTAPTRNDKGEIEVPKGGSVTLPDGSVIGMPDGGKLLPNGTVIINRPDKDGNGKTDDGTITIPGKTDPTKPDVTDKDGQPEADAKVIELVYQINDGKSHDEVTVKVVKGDTVSILDCPFTWDGHQFVNWMGTDNKEYASGANYTAGDNDLELHAQWVKVNDDGSIELPGKDGSMTTPEDNVLVTPDKPNGTVTKQPDGSAKVEGNSGTVNRPKDPDHLDQGKENIKVPEGTIVKPDGTIILPDNGGTINPGDKFPGTTLNNYVSVVYKANGGTGDDVIDLIKNGQPINARTNTFTKGSQTFTGWNTAENGVGGTAYAEGDEITIPNNGKTITLYAQWNKATYTHSAKITYQANDGVTNAIEDTVGANDSTKFSINLRSNPFSVSGWDFGGWNTEANGTGTLKAANAVVEVTANNDQTWFAQWYKVGTNGSITVPGDGNPNTTGDNVTANGTGLTRDPDTGNISIPAGGNVVKGNETIALPNGGTLKPDGSLSINKQPNGGDQIEVKPDGSTDNADVVVLTYEANNGTNDTRKVYATKNEAIAPLAADTFSYSGHAFLYWKSGDTIFKTNGTITPTDAMTLSAVWAKVNNGSIELPGKDGELEAPKDEDNVIVTPDKPNGKVTPQPDGSVKVEDNGGTVTRPTDPEHPENGKEEIKVPEGTVVEPDGTIKLPDNTTINPDQRIPDDVTPTDYYVVTYEPGDGSGDVIRQIVEKDTNTTLLGADTFTAPNSKTFDGWLDELDSKHDADSQVAVTKNTTLTAQWKDKNPDTTVYTVTITYHNGNDTKTKTQRETGNSKQFSATLNANSFTAPTTDWTFMGWTTDANGGKNGTFYKDGGTIALDVTADDPDLYAVWYHKDDATGTITLPGKDNDPTTADNNVTVNTGIGTAPTVKNDSNEGYIEANGGNTVQQPAGTITVIDGPVRVYPDGTVFVPTGSKVTDKDGNEVTGPATIDPDGNVEPGKKDDPKKDDTDNSIIIPGKDGFIDPPHDEDNLIVKPDGNGNQTGSIDNSTGDTTITAPDGADVSVPGKNPPDTRADIKLPQGTVIKPDGTIILPDDKNGKDENGGTIPGGSTIDKDGVVTYKYTVVYLDSSNNALLAPTFLKLKAGERGDVTAPAITGYTVSGSATKTVTAKAGDTYTVTFIYTKNSTGGGGSSGGGGGGGSSTVSSYTIKASAGNGGIISPSGNVSVKRGNDQTFSINPINGYRISDVIVDGKSVGAVSTYTFDSVKANHTIQVKFVKYNSIVADPEVTGVAGWLQTKEHNGYMGGYGNGLFGPNDNMTRAQAAQMFYNLLLNKNVDITVDFTDVPADAWYGNAVRTLASLGVIKGIGDGQFAPNRTITRAEFTVIAMRFANVSADVTNPFTDISTNDWFYSAVTSAVSYGWINGYGDGSFRPQATITRAEVVTIVNRMLNRTADRNFVDSNATAQFDDVPNTYWAYYNIMEATIAHDHSIDNDGVESWGKQK